MRLTTVLLIVSLMQVSASSMAQRLTYNQKKATLAQIFQQIRKQTGYNVLVSSNKIQNISPKDVNFQSTPLLEVLDEALKDLPLTYEIEDKTILIKEKENGADQKKSPNKKAIPIHIKGKVLDQSGQPIPNVNILIKGTDIGTISNQLGDFSIPVPENSSRVLVFSYLGYEPQEYQVKNAESIFIVMNKSVKEMDEVVVVGYGTQKKKDVLNAVSTMTSKDIADAPTTASVFELLNGRLNGLNVVNRSGQPGKYNYDLITRGNSSNLAPTQLSVSGQGSPTEPFNNTTLGKFNFGNNMPLILIDGVEGDLNLLNPQDVESITLLKDAGAAIYGIRAANGVLLVTTKKGAKGKATLDYQYYVGVQSIKQRPSFLPSWQQAVLVNEAIDNEPNSNNGGGGMIGGGSAGGPAGFGGRPARPLHRFTDEEIQKYKDGTDPNYPNTDWVGLVYQKPGVQQEHNLSLSGGDTVTTYRMSFEYLNRDGNIDGVNSKRYNARVNLKSKPFKNLAVEGGLNFAAAPANEPGGSNGVLGDILQGVNTISPMVPLRFQNGAYSSTGSPNPIAWLHSGSFYKDESSSMNGNIGLLWTPIKDLVIRPLFGFNYSVNHYQVFGASLNSYMDTPPGSPLVVNQSQSKLINNYIESTSQSKGLMPQITAAYEKVIGNHLFNILAGASENIGSGYSLFVQRQNLLNNSLQALDLASADGQIVRGSPDQSVQQSVFGRLTYNYADRYYIESTVRGDGTTVFSPERRWGIFPSFAGAWVVSNESFFQKSTGLLKVIDYLKFRASWSRLGNNSIGNFSYLTRLAVANGSLNNQLTTILFPQTPGNPNINWETTTIRNIGLDANLFANKLSLSIDVYNKETNGILLALQAPGSYGYNSPPAENVGEMNNRGVEILLGYKDRTGQFKWSVKGNFSYNKNKILKYLYNAPANNFDALNQNVQGHPYQGIWGLEAEGIYQTQAEVDHSAKINNDVAPGDIKYKDQNGDGLLDGKDIVFLGNAIPTMNYGLALNGALKGFELSLFFAGSAGKKVSIGSALGSIGDWDNKVSPAFWDRWTPSNPTNKFPRAFAYNSQNNPQSVTSSFWVRDASYVRLQNVTLSYIFKLSNNKTFKGLRVFYSGYNLFTYAPGFWNWLDPETSNGAASVVNYPSSSIHAFGLNVQF